MSQAKSPPYLYIGGAVAALVVVIVVSRACGSGGDETKPPAAQTEPPPPQPASASRTLPSAVDAGFSTSVGSDAEALDALARAWSTGEGWSAAVAPDGLAVAVGDGKSTVISRAALAASRTAPPPMPTPACAEATLNQTVGEPFVGAYYGVDAKVRPWPSTRSEWSSMRCYGLDAPEQPAVRACIEDTAAGPRVRGLQVGLSDRPDSTEETARAHRPRPPVTAPAAQGGPATYNVVGVQAGDELNARARPEASAPIVHRLSPKAKDLKGTGQTATKGRATWLQIETASGPGWVNRRYLARRPAVPVERDPRYVEAAYALLDALVRGETPPVGDRGLFFIHFGDPLRVSADEWDAKVGEPRTFDSAACEACVEGSVRQVIGGALTDALRDTNAKFGYGQVLRGPSPSWPIPVQLSGFTIVSAMDPQDLACIEFDWLTAIFFFDADENGPVLAGVAFDSWSP